jgi:hypothetical protein
MYIKYYYIENSYYFVNPVRDNMLKFEKNILNWSTHRRADSSAMTYVVRCCAGIHKIDYWTHTYLIVFKKYVNWDQTCHRVLEKIKKIMWSIYIY